MASRNVVRAILFAISFLMVSMVSAQEKIRFPIGESSKTWSYGPLWVASKMGFYEREGLDVPIITMRGSPLTIQALTADSIYVANATVDTLIFVKGGEPSYSAWCPAGIDVGKDQRMRGRINGGSARVALAP
jgi:ABC-type nitrate/sulfonate/bicarbonate transport system substrate-binding protein